MIAKSPIIRNRRPSHPGEVLYDGVIAPNKIKIAELARVIGVSRSHLSQVLHGHLPLDRKIAARLSKVLDVSLTLLLNMQAAVDAWDAKQDLESWTPERVFYEESASA